MSIPNNYKNLPNGREIYQIFPFQGLPKLTKTDMEIAIWQPWFLVEKTPLHPGPSCGYSNRLSVLAEFGTAV
jgi:hypothetical protein